MFRLVILLGLYFFFNVFLLRLAFNRTNLSTYILVIKINLSLLVNQQTITTLYQRIFSHYIIKHFLTLLNGDFTLKKRRINILLLLLLKSIIISLLISFNQYRLQIPQRIHGFKLDLIISDFILYIITFIIRMLFNLLQTQIPYSRIL